jgi:hypothetical protein
MALGGSNRTTSGIIPLPIWGENSMLDRDAKIQMRAYTLWEQMGYPHGADWDHWYEAEKQVDTELLKTFKPKKAAKPKKVEAKPAAKAKAEKAKPEAKAKKAGKAAA